MLGSQGAKLVLQLASVAVLARLLDPDDYGLIALVMVVVGAGEIFRDFGLTSASIQAPVLTREDRSQLFWVNALIGLILASIVFALSWPAVWVAGHSEMRPAMQALSLLFILNGLMTQYRADLMRSLRFKAIAIVDVFAAVIGLGVAIVAAAAGLGYWALVLQQLAAAACGLAGAIIAGRWAPRWPRRDVSVRHYLRFGGGIVSVNLVSYLTSQLDTVLVGLRFGTVELGIYSRAFQLVMTPLNQVRAPIGSVAQPVFARIQADQPRFERYVVAGQLALGYGIGLPLCLLVATAHPVVAIMLGDQWMGAVPILQLFSVAAFFSNLAMIGYWIYVSRGLVRHLFRYTMISLSIKVACILVGSLFGVIGIAAGFAAAPLIAWPVSLWFLHRITPVPIARLYGGAFRVICLGIAVGVPAAVVSYVLVATSPILQLSVGAATGLVCAATALALPVYRRDARLLREFVRLMLARDGAEKIVAAEALAESAQDGDDLRAQTHPSA